MWLNVAALTSCSEIKKTSRHRPVLGHASGQVYGHSINCACRQLDGQACNTAPMLQHVIGGLVGPSPPEVHGLAGLAKQTIAWCKALRRRGSPRLRLVWLFPTLG